MFIQVSWVKKSWFKFDNLSKPGNKESLLRNILLTVHLDCQNSVVHVIKEEEKLLYASSEEEQTKNYFFFRFSCSAFSNRRTVATGPRSRVSLRVKEKLWLSLRQK